ncbi:hypothetical protein VSU19_15915, partial [Verrucomicrobiales bacterium BCK34]|nr:hypothetical protein [Verrucomicrobiales bacterium BCK34]
GGSVESSGSITATAPSAGSSASVLIQAAYAKVDGAIRAEGGSVKVSGSDSVELGGAIDVSSEVGNGGSAMVEGANVSLASSAAIDASGATGGGSVKVGGGFQGKDATIGNATTTTVAEGAAISVDALESGDAGTAIVWADDSTLFRGDVSARAKGAVGNGGFVEVSGKKELTFDGTVSTLAENGENGTLLLDPGDLSISNAGAAANNINVGVLTTALGGGNVVISTDPGIAGDGTISVLDAVSYSTTNSLALLAHGNVEFSAGIQNSSSGDVTVIAGWNGSQYTAGAPGTAETGNVTFS